MSKLTLYKLEASPPARAVMVLGDMLGLNFEYKDLDFVKLEHKSPEYLKLNPLGTVPLLKDGDFYLTDSHAMLKYLLSKYGGEQNERLYPSDIRTRALVDQALFFDAGVFFIQIKRVALPTLFEGMKSVPDTIIKNIEDAYSVVEAFLTKNGSYLAGEQLTIADISVGLTTAAMQSIHILDKSKLPRMGSWYERLCKDPVFSKHASSVTEILSQVYNSCWEKNNIINT